CLCVLPRVSLPVVPLCCLYSAFFFNAPPTPEIYTLSLHDALPISPERSTSGCPRSRGRDAPAPRSRGTPRTRSPPSRRRRARRGDRKSTRLNSSHVKISYAVFCLKKKKK